MKHLLILFIISIFSFAQNDNPVSLSFSNESLSEGEFNLQVSVDIDNGWRIYSQYKDPESPIIPVSFYFEKEDVKGLEFVDSDVELITGFPFVRENGDSYEGFRVVFSEPEPIEKHDIYFDLLTKSFEGSLMFTQRVKVDKSVTEIVGKYEYQTCDKTTCLAPILEEMSFKLEGYKEILGCMDEYATNYNMEANTDDDSCKYSNVSCENNLKREIVGLESSEEEEEGSLWAALLAGIIAGFIALITPCVFPMIPLTVSFFLKGSGNRRKAIFKATFYGFCIVLIYLLLSLPFHFFQIDAGILNQIATNAWLNLIFFIVFLVFALSFFGYFEIRLPSKFINKVDSASDIGGLLGIFFMALTLALVSFSCTGPVLGAALAKTGLSASGSGVAFQLSASMVGFGLALGIPFALFAMFPSLLKSLPKSGGWMNTFKVFIGFLEIALAIKFLSNADVVHKFGLIYRETFFALWAVTFFGLALYLIGGLYFPHDDRNKKIGFTRMSLGFLVLAFVIYLIPGATCMKNGPNYSLLGLPPPKSYAFCDCEDVEKVYDYFEALQLSRELNKPVLVDFTGLACVNCRKLEDNVWAKDPVDKLLDDFVITSLYVDDRDYIPHIKIFDCKEGGDTTLQKELKTIGQKWTYLSLETFQKVSQPLHIILFPSNEYFNQEELCKDSKGDYIQPIDYSKAQNVGNYTDFLEQGLKYYNIQLNNEIQRGWYFNGQVKWEGEYKDGMKDGVWRYYDENGNLIKEENYIEGEINSNKFEIEISI